MREPSKKKDSELESRRVKENATMEFPKQAITSHPKGGYTSALTENLKGKEAPMEFPKGQIPSSPKHGYTSALSREIIMAEVNPKAYLHLKHDEDVKTLAEAAKEKLKFIDAKQAETLQENPQTPKMGGRGANVAGASQHAATSNISPAEPDAMKLGDQKPKKPKLLLMGLKRSGKSSISNVVFRKMQPDQTLFLEATTTIQKEATHTFMDFQIWDLPGQIDYLDPVFDAESIFGGVGAMIWILDAIDNYMEPIGRLTETILHLQHSYPDIKYSVFIHKVDSLSEDFREETTRDIIQRITDDLFDNGMENPAISYHSTSIYDCSIYEAFSKVMQALVPELPTFEALLGIIRTQCRFEKVYLFDVWSKIYIASDSEPPDLKAYEICSSFIDLIVDNSEIYGYERVGDAKEEEQARKLQKQGAEALVANFGEDNTLYLREIDRNLSFIGISKHPDWAKEKPLMDHNISKLRENILRVMKGVQSM